MQKAKWNGTRKRWLLLTAIAALALALLIGTGLTLAYLKTGTASLTNLFRPSNTACQVTEERFDGLTKENVAVRNLGDIDAYLRVSVICNFVDANGNVVARIPEAGTDYTLQVNTADWFLLDGYYYCKAAVAAGETSPVLFTSCVLTDTASTNAYQLKLVFAAQCIQAAPAAAVESAWQNIRVNEAGLLEEVA